MLTGDVETQLSLADEMVLHPQVPAKVSVFAWWLIRDRLPTKANMAYRGVIPTDDMFCVFGCGHVETAEHLFLSCSTFAPLWQHVRGWIGCDGVDSIVITDHMVQFSLSLS